MPVSESQKKARNKYDAEHFETFTVKIKKDSMKGLYACLDDLNEPRNKFIQDAIDERIKALKGDKG